MNLLSLKFWLNIRPVGLTPFFYYLFIGIILLLLAASIASWIMKNRTKNIYTQLWKKLFTFFLTNYIIALVILFFNYELIPVLSARFWFLLWGISIVTWLKFIYSYAKSIPDKVKTSKIKREFNKYLP